MKSLLQRFRRPAPLTAKRPLSYSRLTLDDWRSSSERVAYVSELLKQPLFLDLLGMLANLRPLSRGELTATMATKLLGQREGHDQVIATLLAAGTPHASAPQELPPADYSPENVMAAWNDEVTEERT